MFCPRCGQQGAEEVRVCSRGALPHGAAADLVEAGGLSASESAEASVGLTPRQRGTRKGLMIMAGGVVLFVIVAFLMAIKEDFFPFLFLAGLIFTFGVMRMFYGLLLEAHAPKGKTSRQPAELPLEKWSAAELPPARALAANVYAKSGAQTNDMDATPSVTESTTRLLNEEADRE